MLQTLGQECARLCKLLSSHRNRENEKGSATLNPCLICTESALVTFRRHLRSNFAHTRSKESLPCHRTGRLFCAPCYPWHIARRCNEATVSSSARSSIKYKTKRKP